MTRGGEPIETAAIRNRRDFSNPHIAYSFEFEQWQAARAAGLDLWRWENHEYPTSFMEKVIAWYRSNGQIEQHTADASISLSKRNQKKK